MHATLKEDWLVVAVVEHDGTQATAAGVHLGLEHHLAEGSTALD